MKIRILVEVDVSHVRGVFASREVLTEKLCEELAESVSGEICTDDDALYNVDCFRADEAPAGAFVGGGS